MVYIMKCCKSSCNDEMCCHTIIGPGDDDYGRDNMKFDWSCPECGNIQQLTGWEIKHAGIECSKCGYKNEEQKRWDDMWDQIKETLKKRGIVEND